MHLHVSRESFTSGSSHHTGRFCIHSHRPGPGEDPLPSPGRGWQGEALTGVGRHAEPTWYRPLFRRCGGTFPQGKVRKRPRRRKPSPTGKVAGPKALTDEGPHPNNETGHVEWKTPPFNVACFSLFGCFPSSVPGCARSTFPVGEGDLRRGALYPLQAGEGKPPCALRHRGADLSSRNPGSFLRGWGGAASGWPCFRSGGSALSLRRRSGPPLPGCGSGRRTYRSASAARLLPAQ